MTRDDHTGTADAPESGAETAETAESTADEIAVVVADESVDITEITGESAESAADEAVESAADVDSDAGTAAETDTAAAETDTVGQEGAAPSSELAELRDTVADLQATVSALVDRLQSAPAPVPGATPATEQASRIIVMANRAAESTVEEARVEAQHVLDSARAQSSAIVKAAQEVAREAWETERDRVVLATSTWTSKRTSIMTQLGQLGGAIDRHRAGLEEIADVVASATREIEALAVEVPVLDQLPAPDPEAFVAAHLPGSAAELRPTPSVVDLTGSSPVVDGVADGVPAPAPIVATGEPVVEPASSVDEPAPATDDEQQEPPGSGGPILRPGLFGR